MKTIKLFIASALILVLGCGEGEPEDVISSALDVLPDQAVPVWDHDTTNGTSQIAGDVLQLTSAESWEIENNRIMTDPRATFLYNDPEDGLDTWELKAGRIFSIEFRMRVNAYPDSLVAVLGEVGVKLQLDAYNDPALPDIEFSE